MTCGEVLMRITRRRTELQVEEGKSIVSVRSKQMLLSIILVFKMSLLCQLMARDNLTSMRKH